MKKKMFLLFAVVVTLMLALVGCGDHTDTPKPGGKEDDNKNNGWTVIESPSMTDVYKTFLGGFTSIAGEFSKSKLKTSPKVSADASFNLSANNNRFWASVRLNYNNNTPETTMFSFELYPSENSSSDDVTFGAYVFKEQLYLQFGKTTRFSLDLKASQWASYFPFENTDVTMDKLALFLSSAMVTSEETKGKSRMNGLAEEYNYVVNIDLSKSLKNLLSSKDISGSDLYSYGEIISGVFGVTVDEIKAGDFPKSNLKVDFTTSNRKMSAFNMDLNMEEIKNKSGTVFGEDSLKLNLEMQKFAISKDSVSVPFVLDENKNNRDKFVYYKDNAFKLTFDSYVRTEEGAAPKKYVADFKAKVFLEDSTDNYAFIEMKDPATLKPKEGIYVYKNTAYLYTTENGEYVCKVSFPLDLSLLATKTINNDFLPAGERKTINWLDAAGYMIKNVKVEKDGIGFFYDVDFYKNIWVNMRDMLDYIDGRFEENIYEQADIKYFCDLMIKNPSELYFSYDKAFIMVVADNDAELTEIKTMLASAEPPTVLIEKTAETGGEGQTDTGTDNR